MSDNHPGSAPSVESGSLQRTDEEWRALLDADVYNVTRHGATERPESGCLYLTEESGTYSCACCATELFRGDAKYHSGSGWPSFFQPSSPERVELIEDHSLGMVRTEVRCAPCGAHLGHVFPDGPQPTGKRFCINSLALQFEPDGGDR
jgi:peptide-methionine (R)-S-oxide reductase